jgi:prefoldin subunit 5
LSGDRVDDGLRLLEISLRRLVDKYQHLVQSIQYLGEDIALLQENFRTVSTLVNDLKKKQEEKSEVKKG